MTVKEIVKDYLEQNDYDGLCREGCGCGLDDIMPCKYRNIPLCEPAYNHGCNGDCAECGDGELCELIETYSTEKPEAEA